MDLVMNAKTLRHELGLLGRTLPKTSPIAALTHARLTTDGQELCLVATDTRVGMETRVGGADVTVAGSSLVPVSRLSDLLGTLPDADVRLRATDGRVRVEAESYRGDYQTQPVEDYPTTPAPEPELLPRVIPAALLHALIKRTRFAISRHEDPRGSIQGALLTISDHELSLVSTDGHRLAWAHAKIDDAGAASAMLSPAMLDAVLPILEGESGAAEFVSSDRHAFITVGARRVFGLLIEGQFPAWQRLVPEHDQRALVKRVVLLDALRRARMTANQQGVVFEFEPDRLRLSAEAASVGSGSEELSIGYQGPSARIAMNGQYVAEWLATVAAEDVIAAFRDHERSVRWSATDGEIASTYVVMPLRV